MSQMKQFFFLFFCLCIAVGFSSKPSHPKVLWSVAKMNKQDSLEFTLFPNPVKNKIVFVESSSEALKHIEVYDVLGTIKFTTDTYENRILLDELKTGIYIFVLQQEDQKAMKRLVIP